MILILNKKEMDFSSIFDNFPFERSFFYLIHSRKIWEFKQVKEMGYDFSAEELDAAEKRVDGFIGKRNGINCYIQKPLIP